MEHRKEEQAAMIQRYIKVLHLLDADKSRRAIQSLVEIGEASVEPLLSLLEDDEVATRWWAIEGLGQIKDQRAIIPILHTLTYDDSGDVLLKALQTLIRMGEAAVGILIQVLQDDKAELRKNAIKVLAGIGGPAIPALITSLHDDKATVRTEAARCLGMMREAMYNTAVVEALQRVQQKERDQTVKQSLKEAIASIYLDKKLS
ncbi:MAG: HEAT repeat domain-containing protein [Promethearchaeota archaeon]